MSEPVPGGVDVPKDHDKDDEPKEKKDDEELKSGKCIQGLLNFFKFAGVKDDMERQVRKANPETPDEISKETKAISERMNKLDVLITIGLYYSSLFMSWLTLLGRSTSVKNFFFD